MAWEGGCLPCIYADLHTLDLQVSLPPAHPCLPQGKELAAGGLSECSGGPGAQLQLALPLPHTCFRPQGERRLPLWAPCQQACRAGWGSQRGGKAPPSAISEVRAILSFSMSPRSHWPSPPSTHMLSLHPHSLTDPPQQTLLQRPELPQTSPGSRGQGRLLRTPHRAPWRPSFPPRPWTPQSDPNRNYQWAHLLLLPLALARRQADSLE